jgi:hypothetical protein
LIAAPYNLVQGDSVQVKIIAQNFYGDSVFSAVGSGAYVEVVPTPPLLLANNPAITDADVFGINW